MVRLEVGDVVADSYGREGIVIREEARPDRRWLETQSDVRLRDIGPHERWLAVMPLTGGLVITPESLSSRLRSATDDDVRQAVITSNAHGVRYLMAVFPAAVRRILGDSG